MTTTTMQDKASTGSSRSGARQREGVSRLGAPRRRRVPHLIAGALLVIGCAAGGLLAGSSLDGRAAVLVLARPVLAGQILAPQDLRPVDLPTDTTLQVVAADSARTVIGHPVAYDLPAGTVLTRALVGPAESPPDGQAVAAIAAKPGQVPPNLGTGAAVRLLAPTAEAGEARSWPAVVTGITVRPNDTTILTVQLSEMDARVLAAVPAGTVSVIAVGRR